MRLTYVTSNSVKVRQATAACEPVGIILEQQAVHVDEIQAADSETVARHKATRVFEILQKPLVISDDSWHIPGLKGFPGPYMRYINDWFAPEDWLRLTRDLPDRRIVLRQVVIYQDKDVQKVFSLDLEGTLLPEIRGRSPYPHHSSSSITSFDGGKTSNAEHHERGEGGTTQLRTVWHDFSEWYIKEYS